MAGYNFQPSYQMHIYDDGDTIKVNILTNGNIKGIESTIYVKNLDSFYAINPFSSHIGLYIQKGDTNIIVDKKKYSTRLISSYFLGSGQSKDANRLGMA